MKKFLLGLLILVLAAGSGCGIYYGIQYHNIDLTQNEDNSGIVQTVTQLQQEVAALTKTKAELTTELTCVLAENEQYKAIVLGLRSDMSNLQNVVDEMQANNSASQSTINALNLQIANLNNTITTLNSQIAQTSNKETLLNNQINQLENSLRYYETLLKTYQDETKAIATFKIVDKEVELVYNIQVLAKGSQVSVADPTNTEYRHFNGWKVDDVLVDLTEFELNSDTIFVADMTYSYDVNFLSENMTHNSQIVESGNHPTAPEVPIRDGYNFLGWSKDGINIVNLATEEITANTTYIALWELAEYNVKFKVNDNFVGETQTIIKYQFAIAPSDPVIEEYIFEGWTVNGVDVVDVATYPITSETIFTAKFSRFVGWKTIYEGTGSSNDKIVNFGFTYNNAGKIVGLKSTDKFRVVFSVAEIQDNDDAGTPKLYYATKDGEYDWVLDYSLKQGWSKCELIIGSDSPVVGHGYEGGTDVTISVSCTEDGVITVSQVRQNEYVSLYSLVIACVEVYVS